MGNVELHFAQIKTILAMDVLRRQSPEMIRREFQIHLIAYNLIRALMQKAGHLHRVRLDRISFKGSLDTLRHWSAVIHAASGQPRKQAELINQMLLLIANDPAPERPNRSEPRAKKKTSQKLSTLDQTQTPHGQSPSPKSTTQQHPKTCLS